jgi:hypothetical protein
MQPCWQSGFGLLRERSYPLGATAAASYADRILRGACLPWAHPHSASKLIRRSMALLPDRFRVVTATCCAAAGEVGTIYQAAAFDYLGQMYHGTRALITYAGKIISERQAKRRFGTCGRRAKILRR